MTERDEVLQIYTTSENKEWIKERAEIEGKTISDIGHSLVEEYIDRETGETQFERYGTDTQLELVMENIRSDITAELDEFKAETLEELKTVQKVRTAYTIAIWKLLQEDHDDAHLRLAMKFATDRIGREPATEATSEGDTDSGEQGRESSVATNAGGDGA
ncbi:MULTISPECIES: hypothetical protein [Haloarcula]|uniref:Ribbon-helix-helix protein n=1 Tax=Haloarcula argentinensis TaxID=43776 RepID=A0A847US92_HALAR|nr:MULTISPECIES: hypothetical protein [Haloarcula]KAA9400568.1 hypothetical protein Har1131_17870 [Haloarcula sp. CBA1131]KAA9400680.1 hypothetical protein Har1131_18530 [Haloarcula sp. CBA1131]NLV15541.1 hypothetical protein [Haloarcula argentinensis]